MIGLELSGLLFVKFKLLTAIFTLTSSFGTIFNFGHFNNLNN